MQYLINNVTLQFFQLLFNSVNFEGSHNISNLMFSSIKIAFSPYFPKESIYPLVVISSLMAQGNQWGRVLQCFLNCKKPKYQYLGEQLPIKSPDANTVSLFIKNE